MSAIGPNEKPILDALNAAPDKCMKFEDLVAKLGMNDKRPKLLGSLRFLHGISQICRIGLDTWAIPERTP